MRFEEDENSFSLNTIPFESDAKFDKGLWLLLVGINEIPPHIALISDGEYYSLSTKKVNCGSVAETLVGKLLRKKIPTVLINILPENTESNNVIARLREAISPNLDLQKIYKDLQPLSRSDKTCLSPIKDFLSEHISGEFLIVNYVFEMLALLERKGLLNKCVSLNCNNSQSNRVTLPKYTMHQIRNRINALSVPITSIKQSL